MVELSGQSRRLGALLGERAVLCCVVLRCAVGARHGVSAYSGETIHRLTVHRQNASKRRKDRLRHYPPPAHTTHTTNKRLKALHCM